MQRLTRGKAAKFNFGVTIHRVVRLDLADAAFITGETEIREHWQYVIEQLFEQLRSAPSILRISYLGGHRTGEFGGTAIARNTPIDRTSLANRTLL